MPTSTQFKCIMNMIANIVGTRGTVPNTQNHENNMKEL